jgi:hypothetical protein
MPGWPVMGPAAEPLPGPRLALVVATGVYTADPGLRRLRAPARDADDLAQVWPTRASAASPLPP